MDKLRIQPVACGGTRVSRLITLVTLLLTGPSLASAQFLATSGSMVLQPQLDIAPFTVAGPGFSAGGGMPLLPVNPLASPFHPGNNGIFFVEAASDDDFPLLMNGVVVHGVQWVMPTDGSGFASASFGDIRNLVFTGPGTYFSTFTYSGEFRGVLGTNPGGTCLQMQMCSDFFFSGSGTLRYDVVPFPNLPGSLEISKATFTFTAPEPTTTSLLLIAFAGLAVLGLRRRSRATLLPTG